MSNIPEARVALVNCGHCKKLARGPRGWHTCLDCLERIGKQARCPDCDSVVTIIVTDDEMRVDLRHDPTCPTWLAFCEDSNPDQHDVLWGTITPPQPEG